MRALLASVPPWTDYLTRPRQPYPLPFPAQAGPLAASVESGDPTSKHFLVQRMDSRPGCAALEAR